MFKKLKLNLIDTSTLDLAKIFLSGVLIFLAIIGGMNEWLNIPLFPEIWNDFVSLFLEPESFFYKIFLLKEHSSQIFINFVGPPIAILFVLVSSKQEYTLVKQISLHFMFFFLITNILHWGLYPHLAPYAVYSYETSNLGLSGLTFVWFLDGFTQLMLLLTSIIFPLSLIGSWHQYNTRVKEFCALLLILEWMLFQAFSQANILFFFIFFESVLIPMFLIIGIWGSRERRVYAAYKFLFFTLVGSTLSLAGIIMLYQLTGSLEWVQLIITPINRKDQILIWILLFFGFAVKVPMVPFHAWLPEAHVEAPTVGSVILAGLLLKLGTYAFLRFSLPLLPLGAYYWSPLIIVLGLLSVVYISLVAMRQIDLKKIIAYSSIAHMGFVMIGIFMFNKYSLLGSIYIMISHGLVSSLLFFLVGFLYDRYKTRAIFYYQGLTVTMPIFSLFFFFAMLANASLPGTSSFIGEFLVFLGVAIRIPTIVILLATGVVFSIIYSIWVFNRICFGTLHKSNIFGFVDLKTNEITVAFVLSFFILLLGLKPDFIISGISMFVSWIDCHVFNSLIGHSIDSYFEDNVLVELKKYFFKVKK